MESKYTGRSRTYDQISHDNIDIFEIVVRKNMMIRFLTLQIVVTTILVLGLNPMSFIYSWLFYISVM